MSRWALIICTGVGCAVGMGALARHVPRSVAGLEELADAVGLGIDEIGVSGHRFTADSDIFDCLDLATVRTMTALDSGRAKARIERLPWVATASITRVFPGRIDITVTERSAFAVWVTGPRAFLIDETGRSLAVVSPTGAPGLPRLAGDGAPAAAKALLTMVAGVPEVGSRLVRATRVADRRWSLELTDGLRLELPPEGEATALAELVAHPQTLALLAGRDTILDLRSHREIARRPVGAS